ncbi:MAG: ABC transporter permease [Rhodothermia bacterium]|nr:ABC transporter permease [Rhodothermia bacterium]
MNIIAKIAWRNIWRNKRRSWVLITAIGVGVFCYVGTMTFADGFSIQMVNSSIELEGGHVRISANGYQDNPTIRGKLTDYSGLEQDLLALEGLTFAPQVYSPGMVNSSEQASGVRIVGVEPRAESSVSSIPASIVEGSYLGDEATDEIVIGEAQADRLNVRVGEKVVVMVSDLDNEVSAGAYRVRGLYRTNSSEFEKLMAFVHIDKARELLGYSTDEVSTISIHLDRGVQLESATDRIRAAVSEHPVEVLTWRDRSPILVLMRESYDIASYILVVVLFAAISFSIINSFLMVIFERIREIGIMSANGLRPRQVRFMLYLEAVFIVILGMIAGGLLSTALIYVWAKNGLDLSAFAEGVRSFGIGTVVFPFVDWSHILNGVLMIFLMVLLSVLYPAFKASRFNTVEAINYV